MLSLVIFLHVIEIIMIGILNILILINKGSKKSKLIFSLLSLSLMIWLFGTFKIMVNREDVDAIIFWDSFVYKGVVFIPVLICHFSILFTKYRQKYILFIGYLLSFIFFAISESTLFLSPVYLYSWGGHLKAERFHNVFIVFFIVYCALTLKILFKSLLNSKTTIKKAQNKYIILSFLFLSISGISFLPAYGFNIIPLGNSAVVLFIATIAYAVIRYRLLGVNVIFSVIYFYSFLFSLIYLFFYLFLVIQHSIETGQITLQPISISGVLLAMVFSFIFIPMFNYIKISRDQLFFKGRNPKAILKDLSIKLNSLIKLKDVFCLINEELCDILEIKSISILIFKKRISTQSKITLNGQHSNTIIKKLSFNYIELDNNSLLYNLKNLIFRDELELSSQEKNDQKLVKELKKYKRQIAFPLTILNKNLGVVLLGSKKKKAYVKDDLEFIEAIMPQLSSAINNSLLNQIVENLNKNLQKKVDAQTKKIRLQLEHLQKLLDMRREFLDIASHQLRTPISLIKGASSMLREDNLTPEQKNEFLDAIFHKSIKLGEIVDEILRASEIDTNEFILKLESMDTTEEIKNIFAEKTLEAKQRGLTIKLDLPEDLLPKMLSDKTYFKHILRNLINNAIQYTKKGGSIVVKVRHNKSKKQIVLEVSDTGIGIPKDEIEKLFDKFRRASNANNAHADGSGLGLFIINKIIKAYNGKASVRVKKTELNVGTTFEVCLPVAE